MSQNRRWFLNCLGLGAVASSLLALPKAALAFGRRRQRCVPYVPCEPVVEVPHPPKVGYKIVVAPLEVSHPPDPGGSLTAPVLIPGNGMFPVYGGWVSGSNVSTVTAVQLLDSTTSSLLLAAPALAGLPANHFGMIVQSSSMVDIRTKVFQLKILYQDAAGMPRSVMLPGNYKGSVDY